jgi:hypothetical protein
LRGLEYQEGFVAILRTSTLSAVVAAVVATAAVAAATAAAAAAALLMGASLLVAGEVGTKKLKVGDSNSVALVDTVAVTCASQICRTTRRQQQTQRKFLRISLKMLRMMGWRCGSTRAASAAAGGSDIGFSWGFAGAVTAGSPLLGLGSGTGI